MSRGLGCRLASARSRAVGLRRIHLRLRSGRVVLDGPLRGSSCFTGTLGWLITRGIPTRVEPIADGHRLRGSSIRLHGHSPTKRSQPGPSPNAARGPPLKRRPRKPPPDETQADSNCNRMRTDSAPSLQPAQNFRNRHLLGAPRSLRAGRAFDRAAPVLRLRRHRKARRVRLRRVRRDREAHRPVRSSPRRLVPPGSAEAPGGAGPARGAKAHTHHADPTQATGPAAGSRRVSDPGGALLSDKARKTDRVYEKAGTEIARNQEGVIGRFVRRFTVREERSCGLELRADPGRINVEGASVDALCRP